jgi:hypothetical protein
MVGLYGWRPVVYDSFSTSSLIFLFLFSVRWAIIHQGFSWDLDA